MRISPLLAQTYSPPNLSATSSALPSSDSWSFTGDLERPSLFKGAVLGAAAGGVATLLGTGLTSGAMLYAGTHFGLEAGSAIFEGLRGDKSFGTAAEHGIRSGLLRSLKSALPGLALGGLIALGLGTEAAAGWSLWGFKPLSWMPTLQMTPLFGAALGAVAGAVAR